MSAHFERGRLLFQQHRFDAAEKELRSALAEDAENPVMMALLAAAIRHQDRREEALAEVNRAVHFGPDIAYCHYIRATILDALDRLDEAKAAIHEAIRLDPEDADYRGLLASLHFQQAHWQTALTAAEEGLALDPQNVDCLNYRGMALSKLGRTAAAHQALAGALAVEPENATAHAAKGWDHLHHADAKQALVHFREALRIQPSFEYARLGLVEALKARFLLYRLLLQYFLWVGRMGQRRWILFIGFYAIQRFAATVARHDRGYLPFLAPFVVLYALFCIVTWVADPASNLLLRMSRYGRYALSRDEIAATNWFGGFLAAGLLLGTAGLIGGWPSVWILGIWAGAMTVPVALTTNVQKSRRRHVLTALATLLGAIGLVAWALLICVSPEAAGLPALIFLAGWMLFPWFGGSRG
jgi:Tfp pilus assembly protein PilF